MAYRQTGTRILLRGPGRDFEFNPRPRSANISGSEERKLADKVLRKDKTILADISEREYSYASRRVPSGTVTITIPDGWTRIVQGYLEPDDKIWFSDTMKFENIDVIRTKKCVGDHVSTLICVIRRIVFTELEKIEDRETVIDLRIVDGQN